MEKLTQHISATLKHLRKVRGWSLDKTAQETGVSKAMLGQIEREESSPTISTLWKIASGFRAPFSFFIENTQKDVKKLIYRTGKTKKIHPQDKKIRVMPLFPFDKTLNFELYVIELLPGCEHLSPPHKHGVIEHVITIEGKMEVFVNNAWKKLSQSEGLRFNANQPHGYRNKTSSIVRFHDVIHYK